jgi:hypothetical protein
MFGDQISEQEIRASDALLGVLLEDPDGQAFSGVTIELENLTAWDHRSDVSIEIEYQEGPPCYPVAHHGRPGRTAHSRSWRPCHRVKALVQIAVP